MRYIKMQSHQALYFSRLSLVTGILFLASCYCQNEPSGDFDLGFPGGNLLNNETRDHFGFTVYPSPASSWGDAKNIADESQWLFTSNWHLYGVKSQADSEGIAYIQVNLKKPYYVRGFAVTGYAGGSYKPTGSFFLEGSNDECHWKMVAEGQAEQWHAPGTYPFRPSQIIKALYPGSYQFYRVIAKGWTNGYMIIQNLGLFS